MKEEETKDGMNGGWDLQIGGLVRPFGIKERSPDVIFT